MDKVQKIKDWISKEQEGLMDAKGNFEYPEHEGAYHILCNLDAYIDSLQEEPVSDDLEEAAKNHAVERYRVTRDMVLAEKCKWSFQTGAKWKEKQMMSKAVDAHVNYAWSGLSFGGFDWSKIGLDIGDKCKLIIIKED